MRYQRYRFKHKETIVTILAENDTQYELAVEAILRARRFIEERIKKDPYFLITYEPYEFQVELDEVTSRMIRASKIAKVGPMAAVAGTISAFAVENMIKAGDFALVDNGGDIAMHSCDITIGIYMPRNLNLGFRIKTDGFYSVCTSSGTVGHSVSLGFADAVTVFAKDASIADCFATRIGNEIKENFGKEEIEKTLEMIWKEAKNYVDGILVVKEEIIGKIGNVPKLRKVKIEPDLITRG
ncbi:MAG: UPF0280 family protein [Archaeoglobus sp.]|nr:UPF0280 family protein [Archaeoglobus sp.]